MPSEAPVWRTARLLVAPVDDRSAGLVADLVSHPAVGRWLHPGREAAAGAQDSPPTSGRVAAFDAADGRFVGMLRIERGWLSYAVVPGLWGQGFGAELVRAGCEHVAPGLAPGRLHAWVERDNVRSRRLLESGGFVFRGVLRHAGWRASTVLVYDRGIVRPRP